MKMSDKDFSIDDIINEVNAGKKQTKRAEMSESDDISFKKDSTSADTESDLTFAEENTSELANAEPQQNEQTPAEDTETASEPEEPETSEPTEAEPEPASEEILNKAQPAEMTEEKYIQQKEKSASKKAKKKKAKKKKKKKSFNTSIFGGLILVTIILTVSLVVAISGISLGMEYTGIGKSEDSVTFDIPKNATTDDIAQILVDNHVIENKSLFKLAMKIKKPATIYPGGITLHASMGYATIIDKLAQMRESYETVTVTFPEGLTLLDVANMLQENNVCMAEDFLFEFNRSQGYDFESKIDANTDSFYKMEGFAFPDTYEFYVNDTAYNVTKTIREHFESKITDSMYKKMQDKGMTLSEVITLASIVQWEANSVEDMPKVASVFENRLNDPDTFPSLQSDATKNYITKVIKVAADNDASIEHYTDCYDTYECQGLPAGPICNPGLEAINAVLEPDKTEYYYFCNNLETGKSYFAKTLEEHNENLKLAGLV